MAAIVTLGLDPQYGGTVFGPFQSTTVVLGSEPSQCTITLHEGMGVRRADFNALVVGADRVDTIRAEIPPVARRPCIQGAAMGFCRPAATELRERLKALA